MDKEDPPRRKIRWWKLTGYKLFVTLTTISFGVPKAIFAVDVNAIISDGLDIVLGLGLAVIFFWVGFLDSKSMSWLFEWDYLDMLLRTPASMLNPSKASHFFPYISRGRIAPRSKFERASVATIPQPQHNQPFQLRTLPIQDRHFIPTHYSICIRTKYNSPHEYLHVKLNIPVRSTTLRVAWGCNTVTEE